MGWRVNLFIYQLKHDLKNEQVGMQTFQPKPVFLCRVSSCVENRWHYRQWLFLKENILVLMHNFFYILIHNSFKIDFDPDHKCDTWVHISAEQIYYVHLLVDIDF